MKHLLRVPTKETYAFIEAEYEGESDGAVAAYQELQRAIQGGTGIGMKKLAAVVHEYCTTGAISMGGNTDYSVNERALLSELTKLIRKNK